jgi:hypothetical protein
MMHLLSCPGLVLTKLTNDAAPCDLCHTHCEAFVQKRGIKRGVLPGWSMPREREGLDEVQA